MVVRLARFLSLAVPFQTRFEAYLVKHNRRLHQSACPYKYNAYNTALSFDQVRLLDLRLRLPSPLLPFSLRPPFVMHVYITLTPTATTTPTATPTATITPTATPTPTTNATATTTALLTTT